MGWFHRNNCAITCDTRAQFWWGRRAKNKQKKWCWKLPSWEVNNFRFKSLFSGEPEATTFLSDARQPEVDFLHPSAVTLKKIMGQIVSLKGKTHSNKNLVLPRHILKRKRLTSGWTTSLKNVGCLNSLLTSNVRTVNGTQSVIITGVRLLLFLIGMKDTGAWFLNENEG